MTSRRKSVTFREDVSEVSPKTIHDLSSPEITTNSPTTLDLDPLYLTWLRSATKAQYPFIVDGTFAKHIYHQNFNKHRRTKSQWRQQLIQQGEVAVVPLAEKYGSLGWGSLYDISPMAWVKNYRVRAASQLSFLVNESALLIMILHRRSTASKEQTSNYSPRSQKLISQYVLAYLHNPQFSTPLCVYLFIR